MPRERLPHQRIHDLCLGIAQAAGALLYVASQYDHVSTLLAFMPPPSDPEAPLRDVATVEKALALVGDALNVLCDDMNNHDAVEEQDMRATREAFRTLERLLKE